MKHSALGKYIDMISRHRRIILILVGSLTWSLTMVKSGLFSQWGMGFWGPNGHDGVWHIALANTLYRGSLEMPTFAGVALQNYHIGFDLVLALLHAVTRIPINTLYFQILPIIFSVAIGLLTYQFVFEWKSSKSAALWSVFFVYFGSGLGWIVTLLRGQGLGGESMFWAQQSISTLLNPPFAFSLIILLAGLISFGRFLHSKNVMYGILSVLFFGLVIEIKAYAGVLILGALFGSSVLSFGQKKEEYKQTCKVLVGSLVLSAIVFLPLNGGASGLIKFQPGWFLETMLALSDRFNWPRLYEAIFNWRSGHVYIKAIAGYLFALVLFMLGNFGIRLVFVKDVLKKSFFKEITTIDNILLLVLLGGVLAPMLFVQEGTAWNTIQFTYYALFVSSIYAGISIGKLKVKTPFAILIVLFTIPTTVSTLFMHYLPERPPAKLTAGEMEALNFLRQAPLGVVLTFPYDGFKAKEAEANPPRPLYLYESTAYVSAYTAQPVFLEDEVNLTIMNYSWKTRRKEIEEFYKTQNHNDARGFLIKNNIEYIYWVKPQRAVLGDLQLGLLNVFENKEVVIYKVIR